MIENILIAVVSAGIALLLKEHVDGRKSKARQKNLASLCARHLNMILNDLENHLEIRNGAVRFNETNYCELAVGEFLYDLFTSNIDLFPNVNIIEHTTEFFHHYQINMSTIKSRLDTGQGNLASITEGTYNNLRNYLREAIQELESISNG